MSIQMSPNLKQSQQLQMTPQLQQAIKILMMNRQELENLLTEELKENPILEVDESHSKENIPEDLLEASGASRESNEGMELFENQVGESIEDDFRGVDELIDGFKDSLSIAEDKAWEARDQEDIPGYELFDVSSSNLYEDLQEQIVMLHLTPYEQECTLLLIEYVDHNGFLNTSLEEISLEHDINIVDLEYALNQLQSCEPTGIATRTVQECLLLQLENCRKYPLYCKDILEKYWEEFQKQDVKQLARLLKTDSDSIIKAFRFIRMNLDPRPARQYGDKNNNPIIPDVFVFRRAGKWIISENEEGLPKIKLSEKYKEMLEKLCDIKSSKKTENGKLKTFLNQKQKNAQWIVRALAERNKTIIKVTEEILEHQKNFFEKGIEYLSPMTLKDVASKLDMHESTISRSTSGKYLHCPRGIFELKFFFTAGLPSSSGQGKSTATETVKNWVTEYIRSESKNKILSDQDIANKIQEEKGVKVARRTVAKYREAQGILSSSKRAKQYRE